MCLREARSTEDSGTSSRPKRCARITCSGGTCGRSESLRVTPGLAESLRSPSQSESIRVAESLRSPSHSSGAPGSRAPAAADADPSHSESPAPPLRVARPLPFPCRQASGLLRDSETRSLRRNAEPRCGATGLITPRKAVSDTLRDSETRAPYCGHCTAIRVLLLRPGVPLIAVNAP